MRRAIILAGLTALCLGSFILWTNLHTVLDFEAVEPHGVQLIGQIESYVSMDAFTRDISNKGLSYEVMASQKSSSGQSRPPFTIATVTISNFFDLNHSGKLVVEFFNDRLVGVRFFPAEIDSYLVAMQEERHVDLVANSEVSGNHMRIWKAVDFSGDRYVGWEDLRLAGQIELWIRRYS